MMSAQDAVCQCCQIFDLILCHEFLFYSIIPLIPLIPPIPLSTIHRLSIPILFESPAPDLLEPCGVDKSIHCIARPITYRASTNSLSFDRHPVPF